MSGRGWRRWKSGGLYVSNGRKSSRKKHTRTHSEDYLVGCGRVPFFSDWRDGRQAKNSRGRSKSRNGIGKAKSNVALDDVKSFVDDVDDSSDEDSSLPWIDQRSRLPPSLGCCETFGNGESKGPYHKRFDKSYEEKRREKSIEKSFNQIFSKKSYERVATVDVPLERSSSTESVDEHENLLPYDDVNIDIGSDEEFWTESPTRKPFSLSAFKDAEKSGDSNILEANSLSLDANVSVNVPSTSALPKYNTSVVKDLVESRHTSSPWEHHVWTSKDLRRYLVLKASQRLGGPPKTLVTHSDSFVREAKLKKIAKNECIIPPDKKTTAHTNNSKVKSDSYPSGSINSTNSPPETERTFTHTSPLPKEFIVLRGGTFFKRGSSFDFRNPQAPLPRQRLYSLPSIIVTHSEEQKPYSRVDDPPTPPSSPSSSSSSKQYLQIPQQNLPFRRVKSLKESSEARPPLSDRSCRATRSFQLDGQIDDDDDDDSDIADDEPPPSYRSGRRPSQMESFMSLMCDSSEDESEDRDNKSESGSPPPDKRPAVEDVIDFEEAFVSLPLKKHLVSVCL